MGNGGQYFGVLLARVSVLFIYLLIPKYLLAQDVPATPTFTAPVDTQTNVGLNIDFTWSDVETLGTGDVTYDFSVGGGTCANQLAGVGGSFTFRSMDQVSTTYTMNPGVDLTEEEEYTACVRASGGGGDSPIRTISFTVRAESIGTPVITTISPSTSSEAPSGQTLITISGTNAESGSLIKIFQCLVTSCATEQEVASATVGNMASGGFEISVNAIAVSSATGEKKYRAKTYRPNEDDGYDMSSASTSASYYFNSSLTLSAPSLCGDGMTCSEGVLEWGSVSGATTYKVWRRVAVESCPPADDLSATCYQGTKPFKLLTTTASTSYTDTDYSGPTAAPAGGLSYFVTAHDGSGNSSVRSTAMSFGDVTAPTVNTGTIDINYVTPITGDRVEVYICGDIDDEGQYLEGENYPDITAKVYYKAIPDGETSAYCNTFTSATPGAEVEELLFDALSTESISDLGKSCVVLGEVNSLLSGTSYCFSTCLEDYANNVSTCTQSSAATEDDAVDPDFNGIETLTAGDNGTSLVASWDLSNDEDNEADLITYTAYYTSTFDDEDEPVFNSQDVVAINKEEDASPTSITISDLESGVRYAVKVTAVDRAGNENDPDVYLTATTLDNAPQVEDFEILSSTASTFNVVLSFALYDRNGGTARISRVSYTRSGGTRVDVTERFLSLNGNSSISFSATSVATADSLDELETTTLHFDTQNYFSGDSTVSFEVCAEDDDGNEGCETVSGSVYRGLSRSSFAGRGGAQGCVLSVSHDESKDPYIISRALLALLALLAMIILRRRYSNETSTERPS